MFPGALRPKKLIFLKQQSGRFVGFAEQGEWTRWMMMVIYPWWWSWWLSFGEKWLGIIAYHCISGFVSARHSKKPQLAVKWANGGHPTQSYNSLCQFRSQRRVILKISLCCHTDRYCWRILCCISTVFFHNCLLTQEHCTLFSWAQNISALFVWLWILWRKPKIMPSLRDSGH